MASHTVLNIRRLGRAPEWRRREALVLMVAVLMVLSSMMAHPAWGHDAPPPSSGPGQSMKNGHALSGELSQLGHVDLGDQWNADVWVHGNAAYVGSWSRPCGRGVKIVDVSRPQHPVVVGTIAEHPNTSAEDVMVISVSTPSFHGDLLVVGLQDCRRAGMPAGLSGMELWDVSDPGQPGRLGFFDAGKAPDVGGPPGYGVHELYLFQRGHRAFALLAVPGSEIVSAIVGPRTLGELRIVEVTHPQRPAQVADWTVGRDLGLAFGTPFVAQDALGAPFDCTPPPGAEAVCRGVDPFSMLHSVSANEKGTRAYLSYWDAGMIMLDISVPEAPTFLGRAKEPVTDEGNLHSAVAVPGERLAVTTNEDFSGIEPGGTWGAARIWDIADPTKPVQIGQFRTPNSSSSRSDGWFTVHNPQVRGNRLYLSWYSDGLRVVDISRPDRPREVASFVPPSGQDGTPPLVWGVRVERNLIFLSDMSTGLYILRTGS